MAGGRIWVQEEIDYVAGCKYLGLGEAEAYEAFCRAFGEERRTHGAFNQKMYKGKDVAEALDDFREERRRPPKILVSDAMEADDEAPSVFPALTTSEHHSAERLWERARRESETALEYHRKRHKATLRFPEDRPIALSFISDQHITESGTANLDRMEQDARLVAETEGMYAVLGGDGVDNHIKHHAAIVASGSKPGHEYRMYDHYLSFFEGKVAALISGNHDDWTKDLTDVDQVSKIARRHRIFFAPDYVLLTVTFPSGTEYVVKMRHQYRYSSSFNETHSVKRMWEMDDDDFDVGVVCHKHRAAMEPFEKHGLLRWACRPGSYQLLSGYSRRYGYGMSTPTCPTVILFPDRRVMHGFWDIRWAIPMLERLREEWPDIGDRWFGDDAA